MTGEFEDAISNFVDEKADEFEERAETWETIPEDLLNRVRQELEDRRGLG
jgi:hypothetical protein